MSLRYHSAVSISMWIMRWHQKWKVGIYLDRRVLTQHSQGPRSIPESQWNSSLWLNRVHSNQAVGSNSWILKDELTLTGWTVTEFSTALLCKPDPLESFFFSVWPTRQQAQEPGERCWDCTPTIGPLGYVFCRKQWSRLTLPALRGICHRFFRWESMAPGAQCVSQFPRDRFPLAVKCSGLFVFLCMVPK